MTGSIDWKDTARRGCWSALLITLGGTSALAADQAAETPQPAKHHFSMPKGGEMFPRKDEVSEVKLTAIQTDGRFSVLDEVWHPGFKVPPHFHKEHAEVFYIIEGQVEWTVGGETRVLGPGGLVYIPPDTVHSVKVVGDKDYRGIMIYEPGGYERNIYREKEYTQEQQEQPEIQKKLRAESDFNPVATGK